LSGVVPDQLKSEQAKPLCKKKKKEKQMITEQMLATIDQ
jgi:hypothetical protein